jgi:hypothetical protein
MLIGQVFLDHLEGFELEKKLKQDFLQARLNHVSLQWRTFLTRFSEIDPSLAAEAFRRRPCQRTLVYRGILGHPVDPNWLPGQEYNCTDFNGATYTIAGKSLIGYAYFDRVT